MPSLRGNSDSGEGGLRNPLAAHGSFSTCGEEILSPSSSALGALPESRRPATAVSLAGFRVPVGAFGFEVAAHKCAYSRHVGRLPGRWQRRIVQIHRVSPEVLSDNRIPMAGEIVEDLLTYGLPCFNADEGRSIALNIEAHQRLRFR
jgi:hypothetical protein